METITVVLEGGGEYTWKWKESGNIVMVFYTHPGCRSESIGEYTITREDDQYHLVKFGEQYETSGYNDFFLSIPPGPRTPVKRPHKATTSPLTETKTQLYINRTYENLRRYGSTLSDRQLVDAVHKALVQLKDSFYEKQTPEVKLQIQQGVIASFRARDARDNIHTAGEGGGARLWPMGR